jgi:hypothetical protein
MAQIDLSLIRNCNVLAVNNTWELVPWARAMYAGDLAWWERYGAMDFAGERWTRDETAAEMFGLRLVSARNDRGLCTDPWTVNRGGNSGYQAVNLAYHFGAKEIILLGFDLHRRDGAHWHGDHGEGMVNAPESHIRKWRKAFRQLASDLWTAHVRVVNCTPGSDLKVFPRVALHKALR